MGSGFLQPAELSTAVDRYGSFRCWSIAFRNVLIFFLTKCFGLKKEFLKR
jgi:hypothetical protein